jgi:hypothetical protein
MPIRAPSAVLPLAVAAFILPSVATAADRIDAGAFKRLGTAGADELLLQLAEVPVVGVTESAPLILAAYDARMRQEAASQ